MLAVKNVTKCTSSVNFLVALAGLMYAEHVMHFDGWFNSDAFSGSDNF